MGLGQPAHEVQLGADGPGRPRLSRVKSGDDELGRANQVSRLHDLVRALGVDQHVHAGHPLPDVAHRLDGEPAVHRAVALPQDHRGGAELLDGQPAARLVRVVDDAVLQRQAHLADGGVAAQVLVGQEEHLRALFERPRQRALGVGGGADRAAVPPGEALDRGAGVHVADRHDGVGDAGGRQHVPALLDLVEARHVGHGAAGSQVGQHDRLARTGEHVGGLGHEVHAAEDDELRLGASGGLLGELEAVAGDVGELDDLVALVVVPEHEDPVTQSGLGRAGALHQGRVGGRGQVAGAVHAALGGRVALPAEQEQGERGRLDARHQVQVCSARHGQLLCQQAGRQRGIVSHGRQHRAGRPSSPVAG